MSSCKKPRLCLNQLTPIGRNLFLQHSANSKCELKKPTSEIWKLSIVSKGYLFASQRQEFVILKLNNLNDQKEFDVTFENGNDPKSATTHSLVPVENLIRLNKLLKFPYVRVNFERGIQDWKIEIVKQLLENQLSQAKLDLDFDNASMSRMYIDIHNLCFPLFVSAFRDRIFKIWGNTSQLIDGGCPALNLNFCCLNGTEEFDQIKSTLAKHKIRELKNFGFWNPPDDPNYFDSFPLCPNLKRLSCGFSMWFDDPKIYFGFFEQLMTCCPNLSHLDICLFYVELGKTSSQHVDAILKALEKIKEFQSKCRSSTEVSIKFDQVMSVEEDVNTLNASFDRLVANTKDFQNMNVNINDGKEKGVIYKFNGKWEKDNFNVLLITRCRIKANNSGE